MPYMKHKESSLTAWPTMNVPFSEIKPYIHVTAVLPMNFTVAYWARKGQHSPVCLKTLDDDLKLVEAQVNRSQQMRDNVHTHAGLSSRNGANKGNRASMKDDGGRIPKKPKASTAAVSEGGRPKKHCALCGKHSPQIQHTHNNKECRKRNQHGTPQGKEEYCGNGNFANSAGHDETLSRLLLR